MRRNRFNNLKKLNVMQEKITKTPLVKKDLVEDFEQVLEQVEEMETENSAKKEEKEADKVTFLTEEEKEKVIQNHNKGIELQNKLIEFGETEILIGELKEKCDNFKKEIKKLKEQYKSESLELNNQLMIKYGNKYTIKENGQVITE